MRQKLPPDAILDAAIALADEGGYDGVRQREVAARAGVALGTIYAKFRSKEHILVAAMARRASELEARLRVEPATGDDEAARLAAFFRVATREMTERPTYARAVLRAVSSGVPEIAREVFAYQERMTALVVAAIGPTDDLARSREIAFLLLQLWYATMIGWSAGMLGPELVDAHMLRVIGVVLRGVAV